MRISVYPRVSRIIFAFSLVVILDISRGDRIITLYSVKIFFSIVLYRARGRKVFLFKVRQREGLKGRVVLVVIGRKSLLIR